MKKIWNLYYKIINPHVTCIVEVTYSAGATERFTFDIPYNDYVNVRATVEHQMRFKRIGEALEKVTFSYKLNKLLYEYTLHMIHKVKVELVSPEKILKRLN